MSNQIIELDQTFNEYAVFELGIYERSSVLAGQVKKSFLDGYGSLEEAQKEYPKAEFNEFASSVQNHMSDSAPAWFDESDAGEVW